jgi:tRNA threonylcarbamoyladenosine biosynthesis protein TsaB
MLIVAIDTSGKNGSIAVVSFNSDGGGLALSGQVEPLTGGSYSAELIPKLTQLLARSNHQKSQIDAFAVASGPGSFTGLRVGLSTVKALADALNKPIAAVSVLEAVATQANVQGRILVALDAGRKQVSVGEFLEGPSRTAISERLLDLDRFAAELSEPSPPIFTPDSNIVEALHSTGRAIFLVAAPRADLYARLGAERILAGNTVSPGELDANYIRRSDAEIFLKGTQ